MVAAIVCADLNYGIGSKNDLLVRIPEDMKLFKQLTTGNFIIMGKKTYESLPIKPLPNRKNIVITSNWFDIMSHIINDEADFNNAYFFPMDQVKDVLHLINHEQIDVYNNKDIYIIGGGKIYKELLSYCERVYLTRVLYTYENADTFFPNIDKMNEWKMTSESEIKEHNGIKYQFCIYDKKE